MRAAVTCAGVCFAWCAFGCGSPQDVSLESPSGPTPCDAYCGFITVNCTRGYIQYPTFGDCMTACATFAVSADPNVSTGNTLQCRMLYAVTATTPERKQAFCEDAGPSGGATCQ